MLPLKSRYHFKGNPKCKGGREGGGGGNGTVLPDICANWQLNHVLMPY